jgi:hypothetical protein
VVNTDDWQLACYCLSNSLAMMAARNGARNQLFFTAGPNNYANGLFGVITFGN